MKSFWQHADGKVYAVESDTFGHILGVAGPLDPQVLHKLSEYRYESGSIEWVVRAMAHHDLHPIAPKRG